jgi:hypothetical protein
MEANGRYESTRMTNWFGHCGLYKSGAFSCIAKKEALFSSLKTFPLIQPVYTGVRVALVGILGEHGTPL